MISSVQSLRGVLEVESDGAPASREPAFALRVEPQEGLAATRINPARTLAHVLLDIANEWQANQRCLRLFYAANASGDQAEEDRLGDAGAAIADRLDELQDEARAMIEAATGVSWAQIEGANL